MNQPKHLRRAETQNTTVYARTRQRNTEPKIAEENSSKSHSQLHISAPLRARSYSWSLAASSKFSRASSAPNDKEHLAKLRTAAEEPHVSDSMSSVTMGYLAFKRVLKNKGQSENIERKVVDSRFRTMSMDEAELSVNSRLLMPEQSNLVEETIEALQGTSSKQTNPHLVKKDNTKRPGLKKHRSAPAGKHGKREISLSLFMAVG